MYDNSSVETGKRYSMSATMMADCGLAHGSDCDEHLRSSHDLVKA